MSPAAYALQGLWDLTTVSRNARVDVVRGAAVSQATTPEFDYELDFVTGQPYPIWEQARHECPVFQSHSTTMGFSDRPMYSVTTFADVEAVLRDGQRFSSSINAEHIG